MKDDKVIEPSRLRAKETLFKRHGEDFYKRIAKKGGTTGGFSTSEKAKAAINSRWKKVRGEKKND